MKAYDQGLAGMNLNYWMKKNQSSISEA